MAKVIHLGPFHGELYQPDYELRAYRNGNPHKPIAASALDLRSVVSIQTSKNMQDLSGTFSITLKDKRARNVIREMDVFRIRLRGHYSNSLVTVMKGVVDRVAPAGDADSNASDENTTISGRCSGKYLQITSLFLPIWDPDGNLPTALTFGTGDVTRKGSPTYKAGGTTPYDILNYLVNNYTYGQKETVGVSGVPNSIHWVDHQSRFARNLGFNVPFLQFNEDSMATALKSLEVVGFTEAWMDELGRIVYRRPQWDSPARYVLSTGDLINWSAPRSDEQTATYVEVIPAGDPGVDSGTAQALRAGRAPVPSTYVKAGGKKTDLGKTVSDEFIIETNTKGAPTAKGKRNPWYQRQRRLGLRPQQVTAPLLVTQAQAQAAAEGLLRFYSRMDKGLDFTIPGCPEMRLGFTARVVGELEGLPFDRSGYSEQIAHNYQESAAGGSYTTSVTLTHGRDARDPFTGRPDPKWGAIALPKFTPADLAGSDDGGTLDNSSSDEFNSDPTVTQSGGQMGGPGNSSNSKDPGGKVPTDWTPANVINRIVLPIGRKHGLGTPYSDISALTVDHNDAANARHTHNGDASDHAGPATFKWAADMTNGTSPTAAMDACSRELAKRFNITWPEKIFDYSSGTGIGIRSAYDGTFRYQMIYRYNDAQAGNHFNHVHFGVRRQDANGGVG